MRLTLTPLFRSHILRYGKESPQVWVVFEKGIHFLSLNKMKGGLNMSLILNAVEMANKSGLRTFMHQDPISNERRTSRNQRRTSRVRRTSRNQRRTNRVRRTSQNRRRNRINSFWDNILF